MIKRVIQGEPIKITDIDTIKSMNDLELLQNDISNALLQQIKNEPSSELCVYLYCFDRWFLLKNCNIVNDEFVKEIKSEYYLYNIRCVTLFSIIFNSCLTIYFVLFYFEFFIWFRNLNTMQCFGFLLINILNILIMVLWFCFLAYRCSAVLELE